MLTEHVFERVRGIDMTLAEFRDLLVSDGQIIEETVLAEGQLKALVLYVDWLRPLHVVVHVDQLRSEERIVTVYEAERTRWSPDHRRRRP